MHKSMSLNYEPSSEPIHISAKLRTQVISSGFDDAFVRVWDVASGAQVFSSLLPLQVLEGP